MGPDTNGSLFQVTMIENPDMDERYVVFGCAVGDESFAVLQKINSYGNYWGKTTKEIVITDCGLVYPKPSK